MRAREFISEQREGKMPHNVEQTLPGAVKNNGYYDLYRASMAMAGMDKDGNCEHEPDSESWARSGFVGSYTEEEGDLAQKAFQKLRLQSSKHKTKGKEPDGVNNVSPVVSFKGYPR